MPCPCKEEDEKIIAEVNRRKALKKIKSDRIDRPDHSGEPSGSVHTWDGPQMKFQMMGFDEANIQSIRQISPGRWEAQLTE